MDIQMIKDTCKGNLLFRYIYIIIIFKCLYNIGIQLFLLILVSEINQWTNTTMSDEGRRFRNRVKGRY